MSGRNRYQAWFSRDLQEKLPTQTGLINRGLWNLGKCNGCGRDLNELGPLITDGWEVVTTLGDLDEDLCVYCWGDRVGKSTPCVQCGDPHEVPYGPLTALCVNCAPGTSPRILMMRRVSEPNTTRF